MKNKLSQVIEDVGPSLPITTWSELEQYPKDSFESLSTWMDKHKLLESLVSYEEIIYNEPLSSVQK
jgi:hypothetical protein